MTSNKDVWEPIHEDNALETGDAQKEVVKWILIEIVSALRVPSMDARSDSDPFVTVSVGEKEVHRTAVLHNSPNPIWTIDNGSLFLLELDDKDGAGVDLKTETATFTVKDYDAMQKAKTLGTVEIKLKDLM